MDSEIAANVSQLAIFSDKNSPQAEAIRALAGRLMDQRRETGRRGLVITSVGPGEGASIIAANLAGAIAQAGLSTLLIDGNPADPALGQALRPDADRPGLYELAHEPSARLEDMVEYDVAPNLSLIYAGRRPSPFYAPVLGAEFGPVMDLCLREFEYTIVTAPPANLSAEALRIASVVGYVLIVARRDRAFLDDIDRLARAIREAGAILIGTVLNAA